MRSVADRLIKAYWDGIHPYYPFLHRQTFDSRYQALWVSVDDSESSTFYILLNVVLALGSQLESPSSGKDKGSAIYFARAKDSSQFDPFETPSLLDVQVLLLMGLYLMVDGQFSRAKSVLDIAMYSAQTLRSSFETSMSENRSEEEREIFRCVWHGSHLLSRVVSSSLGQFSQILALASTATEVPIPTCELDTEALDVGRVSNAMPKVYRPSQFYYQTLRLHRILGEIYAMWNETGPPTQQEEPTSDTSSQIAKVIMFDKKLVKYWRALPKALRHGHERAGSTMTAEHTQSCLLRTRYLYCRIMLLLPLLPLAATLSEQISGSEDDCEATIEEVLFQKLILRGVSSARELLELMKRLQGEKQNGVKSVKRPDKKLTSSEVVYTAAAVISEAQKSATVSGLVGQKALDTSWEQGLQILDQTSKPKAIRCASAIQRLWQSRADESASSFEATLNTDFAVNIIQNEEDIMGNSLGDLQEAMLVGPDFAFDDSLEWF
ncbi:hypothetical protein PRZ48_008112 [Zasmidium cellare]|uniref:Xylanolytic transcriptional activator regulatory domain-containing protein n=1 Tax=Zasmidium cellare TaxID=395010 RepID=A0ABR0EFB2_ZASCE|nr:hypothetical protein PRZ48_008112 [Zasmidium cellare]